MTTTTTPNSADNQTKPVMDLTPDVKAEIRGLFNKLQEVLPNFKPRKEQSYLIAEIAKTLGGAYQEKRSDKRIVVAEAGTGVGKTFAYLCPSIVLAKRLNKRLIVSTANVSLQSQLELKDLPLLQKLIPDMSFKVALGRNRYMCRRDIEALLVGSPATAPEEMLFENRQENPPISHENVNLLERMVDEFDKGKWDGVHDNWTKLGEVIPTDVWGRVNCKSGTCTRRVCPYYNECAFVKAREALATTDVIVSNHSLTMASLANDADVLPPADESVIVLDESHHIAKQFRSSYEQKLTIQSSLKWMKNISQAVTKLSMVHNQEVSKNIISSGKDLDELIGDTVNELQSVTGLIQANCNFHHDYAEEQVYRFKDGQLPPALSSCVNSLTIMSGKILRCINAHMSKLQEMVEKKEIPSSPAIEKIMSDGNRLQLNVESFHDTWEMLRNKHSEFPTAKWVTCGGNGQPDLSFHASPISVAEELKSKLWDKCAAAVVTSATMTSLNSFDRFMLETGLMKGDGTQYFRVRSPFDYQNQGKLIVPNMQVDPSTANEEKHTQEIAHYVTQMGSKHKAGLVLFTSYRQLNRFVDMVSPELRKDMLIQGEDTRPNLIRRHKQRVDDNKRSFLVGVASLGEGLDLPQEYLTAVAIAKIPFGNFKEPIDEAEGEYIKSRGGNPFYEQSLPEASAKLVQQVGRLIRSANCSGEVLIFDRRLTTKKYGVALLDSLPPFNLVA